MIVTPAMYALLSAPSVTVPSGATTLALTSSWGYTPPANTHTPASMASRTTAWAAAATSGPSSSGMKSHRAVIERDQIPRHLTTPSRPPARAAHPATDKRAVETDRPPRTHRPRRGPASLQASFRNTGPGEGVRIARPRTCRPIGQAPRPDTRGRCGGSREGGTTAVVPARGSQAFFAVAAQVIPVLLLALAIELRATRSRALSAWCAATMPFGSLPRPSSWFARRTSRADCWHRGLRHSTSRCEAARCLDQPQG
jgi:hypothetical protein